MKSFLIKNMKKRSLNNSGKFGELPLYIIILLACITLITIIVTVLHSYCGNSTATINATSVNSLILSCVTLSITMSVIVPWMMSKTRIYSVAEDAVKEYYDKDFSKSIKKTHNNIFKAYANDSRMIAYMLCQQDKPIWALGWICKSSCTYMKVSEQFQLQTYTVLSTSNIFVLIDCILKINDKINTLSDFKCVLNADNTEPCYNVAIRTTRDLIKFCSDIRLKDRDYKEIFKDEDGKDIPETLKESLELFLVCLVKYLSNKVNLEKVLELDNPEEPNHESHKNTLEIIRKKSGADKEFSEDDFAKNIEDFKNSADILNKLYDDYQLNRCQ